MSVRTLLASVQRLLAGVVLVMSGAYLLIYLYRWEWNRAIVSGLFFVAAEVALASSMILRRLQALEQRDGRSPAPSTSSAQVAARLRAAPLDRPEPFEWLESESTRLSVFVPVLLGAGAILSALAYVIERVAQATALPVLERRLESRLAVLAPPPGGLLGGPLPDAVAQRPGRTRPGTVVAVVLAAAALAVMVWLGVLALLDATQSRPDLDERPARTTLELAIAQRGVPDSTVDAAEALWIECRSSIGAPTPQATIVAVGGDRVTMQLEPGLGELGTRRLSGCLSDLRINRLRAEVIEVDHTPAPSDT